MHINSTRRCLLALAIATLGIRPGAAVAQETLVWERGQITTGTIDILTSTLAGEFEFLPGEEDVPNLDFYWLEAGSFTGSYAGMFSGTWEAQFAAPQDAPETDWGTVGGTYQHCVAGTEHLDPCTQPTSMAPGNKIRISGPIDRFLMSASAGGELPGLQDLWVEGILTVGNVVSGVGYELTGEFELQARIAVAVHPASIDLGNMTAGSTRDIDVLLVNYGSAPASAWIGCYGPECAGVQVLNWCGGDVCGPLEIEGGGSGGFVVRYTPTTPGLVDQASLRVGVGVAQVEIPFRAFVLADRATPFLRFQGSWVGSNPTRPPWLPAAVYDAFDTGAGQGLEIGGFASLASTAATDLGFTTSGVLEFLEGQIRPGVGQPPVSESFVARYGDGEAAPPYFTFKHQDLPLASAIAVSLEEEYATPGGGLPETFPQIVRQGRFELQGGLGTLGNAFFDEVAALTGGTNEMSFVMHVMQEPPRSGNGLVFGDFAFDFLVEMMPVVASSTIAPDDEQTATLLGGAGAEGGVEVTLTSATGGTVSADYQKLTFAQFFALGVCEGTVVPGFDNQYQLWDVDFGGSFGSATVTFHFEEPPSGVDDAAIQVLHCVDGAWQSVPGLVDPVANTITVTVTSFSPFLMSAGGDADGDGLSDTLETTHGTNPLVADTDGDGLLDGLEVHEHDTSPTLADTDGDGWGDGLEVAEGSDPTSAGSAPPPAIPLLPAAAIGSAIAGGLDVADLDRDGDLDLASVSASTLFVHRNDGGFFAQLAIDAVPSGVAFNGVAIGDLDGDGSPDLVRTTFFGAISWYPSAVLNPQGSVDVATGMHYAAYLHDVDGDGDLDVVSWSVVGLQWHENEDPYTDSWTSHAISSTGTVADPAVADVDGDGDADVAAAGTWYENTAGGITWTAHVLESSAGVATTAADLDADGDVDLAFEMVDGSVVLHENTTGDGSAWSSQTIAAADGSAFGGFELWGDLEASDLDDDGDLDLLAASRETFRWLENRVGDASSWGSRLLGAASATGREIEAADFDGDGDLDVLAGETGTPGVLRFENRAIHRSVAFPDSHDLFAGARASARAVATADIDRDGDLDVIGTADAHDVVVWYENDGSPAGPATWTERTLATGGQPHEGLAAADMDGDGDADVVVGETVGDRIVWYENDGTPAEPGTWSAHVVSTAVDGPRRVAVADVDRDGDLDVLSASHNSLSLFLHRNLNGSGTSWSDVVLSSTTSVFAIAVGDVDRNGCPDVVAGAFSFGGVLSWYDCAEGPAIAIPTAYTGTRSIALVDMDRDGDLDIVGAFRDGGNIAWVENADEAGTMWTDHSIDASFAGAFGAAAADLDGDGDIDVLAGAQTLGQIAVFTNTDGYGSTWTKTVVSTADGWPSTVAIGDLDGDGDPDGITAQTNTSRFLWLPNRGGQVALPTEVVDAGQRLQGSSFDVFALEPAHLGRAGDGEAEVTSLALRFEASPGNPLTSAEADALVDRIDVYAFSTVGTPGPETLVGSVDTLALDASGLQTVSFADGEPMAGLAVGGTASWRVVLALTPNAGSQTPASFEVTHVAAASTAEDRTHNTPLGIELAADATASITAIAPACSNGVDDDGDGKIDFDGGASANGGTPIGPADPQCTQPYKNKESSGGACGLGAEVALALLLLARLHRRRRNA